MTPVLLAERPSALLLPDPIEDTPPLDTTRRQFITGVGAAALAAAFLAACGEDDADGTPEATDAADSRFPIRVTHKFGTTEVPAPPQRVVSLGFSDHDPLLALGVVPIAVRYWYSDEPVFPWAQDRLTSGQPPILDIPPGGELDFEAVAAQDPDLIVAVYSGISEEDYARLSQIAPTIAQSADFIDYGMPWDETTRLIGQALGLEDGAEEVIAEVDAKNSRIRDEHPGFVGASGVVAVMGTDGNIAVYSPQDLRTRVLTSLGFEVPAELASRFGDDFRLDLSSELINLLESADVIVWRNERAEVEGHPIYWTLDVAKEGRHVFLEGMNASAFGFNTVLSLPYFIDSFVPELEAALDGDPATVAAILSEGVDA
ncbi:MAG: iron-siderophore ABC transporter substrate-binding protein [Dehalococcoidia bacterium]|nr:iron-siderophore ABC transporter substrate-binding protein [Dehalococcoidia bacterium]